MRKKNYVGNKIVTCPVCGKEFQTFISDNGKYCSRSCYHKSPMRGTRPRNRRKEVCLYCGNEFERPVANFKKGMRPFCSTFCSGKWRTENGLRGKNHPLWNGGYSQIEYRYGWESTKRKVKKRAGGRCEKCGGIHKFMDVHHTIPIRLHVDIREVNHLINLQYLCRPCHMKADLALRGRHPHQIVCSVVDVA